MSTKRDISAKFLYETDEYKPHVMVSGATTGFNGRSKIGRRIAPGPYRWYTIYAVSEGRFSYEYNEQRVVLHGPALLIRRPGEVKQINIPPVTTMCWLDFGVNRASTQFRFESDRALTYDQPDLQPDPMTTWGIDWPETVTGNHAISAFRTIWLISGHWWRGPLGLSRANGLLMTWLAEFVESLYEKEEQVSIPFTKMPRLIKEMKPGRGRECMELAYGQLFHGMDVGKWAMLLGISTRQLSRIIQSELGMTPKQALESMQIEVSMQVLTDHDVKMYTVSKVAGFASRAAFTRAFSRIVGSSPSQWRELKHSAK